jgi:hypothetical protein
MTHHMTHVGAQRTCVNWFRGRSASVAAMPLTTVPQHAPQNAMSDPGEIAAFHDRCSDLMRELLAALALAPDQPRPVPVIEDSIGWPRRRIASVLGGVAHLRNVQFGGRRPYRFLSDRHSESGRWEMWMDANQARAVEEAQRR